MLAAWATCITDGKEKPELAVLQPVVSYDVEVERERLEFENRKFEAELQLKQAAHQLKMREMETQKRLNRLKWKHKKNLSRLK